MKKRNITTILMGVFFIIGFLVMAYPFISNFWNQMRTETVVREYKTSVEKMPDEDLEREYQRARSYNDSHNHNNIIDIFSSEGAAEKEYISLLNLRGEGVIGYIEIPKIKQRIVIYHGTSEEVLQKGCGHIAGTSLPVGGKSSHSVIAAHRGLPSAKLFTDIDELSKGDEFYIFVLDKTLAYQVDQIKVVEPNCLEELQISEGKDYVTLFTCTPYSVNTHRLLVRGHRVPYAPGKNDTQTVADSFMKYWPLLLMIVLLTILLVYMIYGRKRIRMKRGG